MTPAGRTVRDSAFGAELEEVVRALGDELAAAREERHDLDAGERLSGLAGIALRAQGHLYRFETTAELRVPEGAEARLDLPGDPPASIAAVVERVGDGWVELVLEEDAGPSLPTARLAVAYTEILERLRTRLRRLLASDLLDAGAAGRAAPAPARADAADDDEPIEPVAPVADLAVPERLLGLPPARRPPSTWLVEDAPAPARADGLNARQREAVARCLGSRFHAVWGPPGTGKTRTLAALLAALLDAGERVLVLATANVAVDQVVAALVDRLDGDPRLPGGAVFRAGVPRLDDVVGHPDVTLAGRLDAERPDLVEAIDAARRARRDALRAGDPAVLAEANATLQALLQERDAFERRCVARAHVVVTTFAKQVASGLGDDGPPVGRLIVDEASMASVPYVLSGLMAGARHLHLFGDPRQLPPVHVATTAPARRWLGRDLFELAGLVGRADGEPADPDRLTLLEEQYRMRPALCGVVGRLAYGGRLSTGPGVATRPRPASAWPPGLHELVLVDAAAVGARTLRTPDGSIASPLSALAALAIAAASAPARVALLTPYRAQARLHYAGRDLVAGPVPSTLHGAQGAEADVAILDLAHAPPRDGHFIAADSDLARRLLTVGASRARDRLVVLCDFRHAGASDPRAPLRVLLHEAREAGATLVRTWPLLDTPAFRWRPEPLDPAATVEAAGHQVHAPTRSAVAVSSGGPTAAIVHPRLARAILRVLGVPAPDAPDETPVLLPGRAGP